jgi:hypothetical protein
MSMGMAVVMVMAAMLIMDMTGVMAVMGVIMIIVMVMVVAFMIMTFMIMAFMIVACMIMGVTMRGVVVRLAVRGVRVAAFGIGAAFGIERRFDLDHARAQSFHHRLDDVIAPDAQAARGDLGRQMAIAEMPGDPDQMLRIGAANLDQRLRRGNDLDQPAIVEHQRVTAAQHNGVFQIEQKRQPARAGHRHPTAMPVVEIKHDGIGRRLVPAMRAADLRGAGHVSDFPVNGRRPWPA